MNRYRVAQAADVQAKGRILVQVEGVEIGIFYVDGQYYAWRNVCPHAAAPVCEGVICGTRLPSLVYEYEYGKHREIARCPWHGWEFDLKNGQHLAGAAKLRGYPLELENGELYVRLRHAGIPT